MQVADNTFGACHDYMSLILNSLGLKASLVNHNVYSNDIQ